jgi:hypothetical protein
MKKILTIAAFTLMMAGALQSQVIFYDALNYPNGGIATNSGGLWVRHSGVNNDAIEVNGRYEVNQDRTDDVHHYFDPLNTNSGYISGTLYASWTIRMTNLPASGSGAYFAHFSDNTFGEFRGRVFALTNGALPGAYRLGVANAGTSPNQVFAMDLAPNIDYQVVLKYDLDLVAASLYINPASESDPGIGPTGDLGSISNALTSFAFRQAVGIGVIHNAKVLVGQTFADVVTNPVTKAVFGLQPVNVTNFAGNSASLSVLASGKGVLSYQWFSNTVAISGANSNVYTMASLSAADQGTYFCQVSNGAGPTNSASAFVSVNTTPTAPSFTLLPQSNTNAYGGVATFASAVVGTGPFSYQWKLGTNAPVDLGDGPSPIAGSVATISGSTTPTLMISNLTKVDATNYMLTVTGGAGSTNASVALSILPPAILVSGGTSYTQSFDSLAAAGTVAWNDGGTLQGWYASTNASSNPVLGYRADSGTGNAGAVYSYGTNGVNPASDRALGSIASAAASTLAYGFLLINDSPTLVVTNISLRYTGEEWRNGGNGTTNILVFSYRKSFSPIVGSDSGNSFTWTLLPALNFITPATNATTSALDGNSPANRVVIPSVLFTNVTLLPGEEIFFRWYDINDLGSDHALAVDDVSLTFTTFTPPHTPPVFTQQPQNATNNFHTSATLTAAVSGFQPMTFQWYKGLTPLTDGPTGSGSTLSGSTNSPVLTIASVSDADAGDYHVAVTNSLGGTNSANAHLTVIDPIITAQPVNVTNVLGDNANFFASGTGTASVGYQWLSNGIPIPGANDNRLDFPVTAASSAGSYSVVVTNGNGDSITSAVANVILIPTPLNKIANWDFNSTVPDANTNTGVTTPTLGTGSASALFVTTDFQPGTFADPASTNVSDDNSGWRALDYPDAGTSNKTAGVQFNVSTVSNKDIMITWEQRNSGTASKYTRLQYSTDGNTFVDHTVHAMNVDASLPFAFFSSDLSGIPGVNNNPNFALRLVTEFQSTAVGGVADYVATTSANYSTAGTIRFDWLNVFANPTNLITRVPLTVQLIANKVVVSWPGAGFLLQAAPVVTGTYTNITGATSPYTNTYTGSQRFFRLKSN